jgi:SAM-dependent methyltransferase
MRMTAFDEYERHQWAGRAAAYAESFAKLCAHPVPALLAAAGVTTGTDSAVRLLDAGTGPGTVAELACAAGAAVCAVDAEFSMVALARRRVPAARLCLGVLPRLPFPDRCFDAVTANFVLNHVGDPRAALRELCRVLRPGGRIAVTVWPRPLPPLQQLWEEIMQAAGVTRPASLPTVAADLDFERSAAGFAGLLAEAGLARVSCRTITWRHHVDPQDWWIGPANGIGALGLVLAGQEPGIVAEVRRHYDALTVRYLTADGLLALPAAALLASGAR